MAEKALAGVRVLDFTRILAGPFCAMLLGDMGADVIKVENPARGDDTRQWGPPWTGDGGNAQSAYFVSVNRNKRSLTLNLKSERGQALVRELVQRSDILIENFKLGQMSAYGLGYENLRLINPKLVYCGITGYGQTGPYRERPGYDYVIQAMSGLMSITGPGDGQPYKVGVATADVMAGLMASTAILSALRHSERTGNGQYIDISLLDSQMAALVNIASNYLVSGQIPPRLGNEHPNIVPYQTFKAADREFVVAVGNDRQFMKLCELIGHQEWVSDPRFATNPARVANRRLLVSMLQEIFATQSVESWIEPLLAAGIPAGPINDVATILNDPHIQARGLVHEVPAPYDDALRFVGPAAQLSETPAEVRLPPPMLGQHTDEILRDVLHLTDEAIAAHRAGGVVGLQGTTA